MKQREIEMDQGRGREREREGERETLGTLILQSLAVLYWKEVGGRSQSRRPCCGFFRTL